MKIGKQYLIILSVILILGGCWWFFSTYYEGEKPILTLSQTIDIIGKKKIIDVTATDKKRGLKKITAIISQNGEKQTLYSEDFLAKGTKEKTFSIEIDPKNLKLREGEARINISAVDHSLRKNTTVFDVKVVVDTTPPRIHLKSSNHYINPGGSCVVVYGVSEEVVKNGVNVGDDFFSGYPIDIAGNLYYVAYFALPIGAKSGNTLIGVVAKDRAGNESLKVLPFHIRNKKFHAAEIHLTENFLKQKMPEFQHAKSGLSEMTPLQIFRYVNEQMRHENFKTIQSICKKSAEKQLWQGSFLRMEKAATTAPFGNRRVYYYKGKVAGKSTHMGIDLASTKQAGVVASNSGIVVLAGNLGIYGDTIIIDHGLGLFSLYGHLGMIKVKENQRVEKGELIGNTDTSGLAGGDHLHFGILVGDKFVNPQEWWDPHWIRDNVERKLNYQKSEARMKKPGQTHSDP